jgi:hypothetical protein
MSASTLKTGAVVMAISVALFGRAAMATAQQPTSLPVLLNRIPNLPATPKEADKMVNVIEGEYLKIPAIEALKADLKAHEAAVTKIWGDADAKIRERMGAAPENVAKGVAATGIDMERMKKDPAYAKEMQAKMKAMSPQELMAMSMAMQKGMGMKATVAVYDPPVVQEAAAAGRRNNDEFAAWTTATKRRWDAVARKVTAIEEKYAVLRGKLPPRPACGDGEGGGGPECHAAQARYDAAIPQIMKLLVARDAEVLAVETPALEEQRAAVAEEVRAADQHLQAAKYGALSQELGNPMQIGGLDAAAVRRITELADKFESIVQRATFTTRCGNKATLSSDYSNCDRATISR